MFHASGMHRAMGSRLRFGSPPLQDPLDWEPAWQRLDEVAKAGESVGVDAVIASLAEAPVGLRAGPALLLIAAYMLRHRGTVALMERGSFQPEITQAHCMRLAKSPRNFALRRIRRIDNEDVLGSLVAAASVRPAFGARSVGELREPIRLDYEDHLLALGSYELRAFVDRALKDDVEEEAWVDGVAGLVVGKRLEGLGRHAGRPVRLRDTGHGAAARPPPRIDPGDECTRRPRDGNPLDDVGREGAVAIPARRVGRRWSVEGPDAEGARSGRASGRGACGPA